MMPAHHVFASNISITFQIQEIQSTDLAKVAYKTASKIIKREIGDHYKKKNEVICTSNDVMDE